MLFQQDANLLLGTIASTFHVLHDDFDKLKETEQHCPDALFIRVLQVSYFWGKSIASSSRNAFLEWLWNY